MLWPFWLSIDSDQGRTGGSSHGSWCFYPRDSGWRAKAFSRIAMHTPAVHGGAGYGNFTYSPIKQRLFVTLCKLCFPECFLVVMIISYEMFLFPYTVVLESRSSGLKWFFSNFHVSSPRNQENHLPASWSIFFLSSQSWQVIITWNWHLRSNQ